MSVKILYPEVINDFNSDCVKLIDAFKEKNSELYRDFVLEWKAFGFNLVYDKFLKRYRGNDLNFKRDSLQIAKSIMLKDNFVCGMYLLYSLYYMQGHPKVSIRIDFFEYRKIWRMIEEKKLSDKAAFQTGLIFAKLIKNVAFSFTALSREYIVEGQNRSRLTLADNQEPIEELKITSVKEWFHEFLNKAGIVEDVENLEKSYLKKKQKLQSDYPDLNLTLDLKPQDFITGLETGESVAEVQKQDESISSKRKSLKNRKMLIKRRYERPVDTIKEEKSSLVEGECSTKVVKKRKKSSIQRKSTVTGDIRCYYEESTSEDEEDLLSDSSSDYEPMLALPDID